MKTISATSGEKRVMLSASAIFRGADPGGLNELAQVAIMRDYAAGDPLFFQEAQAAGFFVLTAGALAVYRTGPDGRRQILHVFEDAGDICGEVPVFEGSVYPAAAEAMRDSRVLYLPRDDFLAATRRHPEILLAMLAELSRRLRRFADLIDDLSLKDVSARMAKYLLSLAGNAPEPTVITLDMPKGMLAERLGTIAETISRTFRRLRQADVIEINGNTIRLLDHDRLEALAEGSGAFE